MTQKIIEELLDQLALYSKLFRRYVCDELEKNNGNLTKTAKMFDTNFYEIKDVRNEHSSASNQYECERLLFYLKHRDKNIPDAVDEKIRQDTAEKLWDKLPKNK